MKLPTLSKIGQSWRAALAAGCGLSLFVTHAALAQPVPNRTQPAAKEEAVALERFVVTGSAIPMAVVESFAPVTVYSQEQLILAGANTPIEGLRDLPSFVG